jgi:CheY-like chemotaxis protein
MLTNVTTDTPYVHEPGSTASAQRRPRSSTARTVVIVNGCSRMSEVLDTAVDVGLYDVVMVESIGHAYSRIKKVQPDLAIISIQMEDMDGFRVLSMLKLDPDTRRIPILTYTSDGAEGRAIGPRAAESDEESMFGSQADFRMN